MGIIWEIIEQPVGQPYLHRTDENGVVSIVPMDEANSDYQAYLRWLENPDAEENGTIS